MTNLRLFCLYSLSYLSIVSRAHLDASQHPSWMLLDHEKCGDSSADRIIGGKNAAIGAYPWIARIAYANEEDAARAPAEKKLLYRCGGSLVNKMYVVTAAHCVANLPGKYRVAGVRLGEHNTETNPDCEKGYCADPVQDFESAQITVHRKYGDPAFKNDIAMIRLDRAARYSDWVKPLCLPSGSILEKDFANESAEVAGWGIYDTHRPKPSVTLQTIKMPIVGNEACATAFRRYAPIGPEQMCVGGKVGADSCGGDSGGPLMKVESGDFGPRYYLIGIVSFGAKHCGRSAVPAVYSRVSSYVAWILDNVSP